MLAQQLTSAHGIVVIFVTANPEMAAVAGHHELPVVRKPFDHATIAAAISSAWSQRAKPWQEREDESGQDPKAQL
jgi:hypothetical protein